MAELSSLGVFHRQVVATGRRAARVGERSPSSTQARSQLADLLGPRGTKIDYLYDFGDSWEHRLTVSDVRAGDPDRSYPRYVRGERNGPPEDCGGIPGFYDKLEAAADPRHPDHREIKKWLRDYDAETIDEASHQTCAWTHRQSKTRRQSRDREKEIRLA